MILSCGLYYFDFFQDVVVLRKLEDWLMNDVFPIIRSGASNSERLYIYLQGDLETQI